MSNSVQTMDFKLKTLAVGILTFTLASLYVQYGNFKLTLFMFPQSAIYMIFGFFHAYNVWTLDSIIKKDKSIFMLVSYTILYSGWYNIVLLPESGIGYMEWGIVFLALTMNLLNEILSKKINNPFMGQSPLVLVYFGVILFILKVVLFYTFSDNIYDSVFLTNDIARLFVVFFAICGIILLLMQFYKHITNRFGIKIDKKKAQSVVQKITKTLGDLIRKGFELLKSFCELPVVLIVVGSVVLILLIIAFLTVNKIYNEILSFVEPFLEKLLDTGENKIHPSELYYLTQVVSMMIVLFYTVYIEQNMKIVLEKNIEKRISYQLQGNEDYSKVFYEVKQKLTGSQIDTELQIFHNNAIVSETIQETCNKE